MGRQKERVNEPTLAPVKCADVTEAKTGVTGAPSGDKVSTASTSVIGTSPTKTQEEPTPYVPYYQDTVPTVPNYPTVPANVPGVPTVPTHGSGFDKYYSGRGYGTKVPGIVNAGKRVFHVNLGR